MLRRDCRHRLGFTVAGASTSLRKPYGSRLQTTLPDAETIFAFSIVPRKPREASSKSAVSANGKAFLTSACRATTEADASLGDCFGVSVTAVWLMIVLPHKANKRLKKPNHAGRAARYGESAIDQDGIASILKICLRWTSSGPSPIRN